jgi:hypothetical protein
MAKQLINTGLTANDGTGDTLRAAFNKVNDNTNELYSALFTNNDLLAFREWAPNTSYLIEDVFYIVIEGSKLFLQVTSAYTSNSLMPDVLDTTNTFLVSQSTPITVYPIEGTRIPAGTLYAGDGSLWQSSQNFTVGEAGFDLAEQATNWTQITTAGLPGTSWVEAERGINSNNPFSSILPKVDGSGSPYVWRFNASGPVALDNTTIIGVRANRDRLWYHPSNDTWFHEKDPLTFQGANFTNAGTEGILPLPQQNDVYRSMTGGGSWLFPYQMADTYPAPYINEIHMGQGCVIKDEEIYELVADGDRCGVRLIPDSSWAIAPTITAKTYNSNVWTVVGQPTSGTHECFVYANYSNFTWEFRSYTESTQSVDYINVRRANTNQTAVTTGSDFIFNTVSYGNILFNTTTGVFTLTAGKVYELSANILFDTFSNPTGGYISFEWVDATTNFPLKFGNAGVSLPTTSITGNGSNTTTNIIYSPSENQTVKVRCTDSIGEAVLRFDYSTAIIRQLGSSPLTGFLGANGTIGGAGGTVPPPAATDNLKFLRGDATWQTINSFNSFKPWINITSSPFTSIINEYYLINTDISIINISLPTAVGNNGAEITFKKINVNTNNAIIIPQVGQTIDGLPSKSLIFQWDILTIRSNGSNWLVLKELPSRIVIKPIHNFTRTGSTQSFNAGTLTTVVFNNNAGSSGISNVSLNTSNGTFTFSKVGNYSMSGVLDMTSATANARGLLQLVGAGANIEGYLFSSIQLCSTANISSPIHFNINFNISIVGDLLLRLTMGAAATLNNISGTGGNTIISRLTITELA